jgi:hypothetical protein
MSDASDNEGSRSKKDPVTGNADGLPDVFGEDPDKKKPLVGDMSVEPDDD